MKRRFYEYMQGAESDPVASYRLVAKDFKGVADPLLCRDPIQERKDLLRIFESMTEEQRRDFRDAINQVLFGAKEKP